MSKRLAAYLGLISALALSLALLVPSLVAQTPRKQGAEFQVSSYTSNDQVRPAAGIDADGDFVVVWSSYGQDGDFYGVFGRRFNASGAAQAIEFQVNLQTSKEQARPAVAVEDDGDFVVVWHSNGQDGGLSGVFARRFQANGTAVAVEFQVNLTTAQGQFDPAVASDGDGDFVVAWESDVQDGNEGGIFARRFDSTGAPLDGEFQVNTYTSAVQRRPVIAADADGDFVIAWQSYTAQDGDDQGVFAQRFNSGGAPLGGELQVNVYTPGSQSRAAVAADADGDFVVAWQSAGGQDGAGFGVFARRFTSAGVAQSGDFQVNLSTINDQRYPAVAAEADGDFLVVWEDLALEISGFGVSARRFDSAGGAQGSVLHVNTYTLGNQSGAVADIDAEGDFIVAWISANGQDGDKSGVFAQRFSPAATLDIDGNGQLGALTDGLLVLRHFFGFTGATLTSAAIGPNCARCDATAVAAYIDGLGLVLDIDNNGAPLGPLTDGLLALRFLFGFTGATLTNSAVAPDCVDRCDAATILPYLQTLD